MELKGKKINFLGDSITEGALSSSVETNFVSLVGSRTGATARNYGIGGTRYARQHKPSAEPIYDQDFCSRVSKMDSDADVIVIFGGTNDFGHGDAPLGCFEDRTPDTFYGACHTVYRSVIEKYPTALIIVITPLHRTEENILTCNPNGAPLKKYVEIIREVAEYYSLPLLDLFASGRFQPAIPVIKEKFLCDGLHPNDAGHSIIADRIISFISQL